ncbi:MAG: hypothetical protein ACKOB6_03965 [Candidatus Kapaibacterium sp.]
MAIIMKRRTVSCCSLGSDAMVALTRCMVAGVIVGVGIAEAFNDCFAVVLGVGADTDVESDVMDVMDTAGCAVTLSSYHKEESTVPLLSAAF